jgi:hypothetical protein
LGFFFFLKKKKLVRAWVDNLIGLTNSGQPPPGNLTRTLILMPKCILNPTRFINPNFDPKNFAFAPFFSFFLQFLHHERRPFSFFFSAPANLNTTTSCSSHEWAAAQQTR